MSLFSAQYKFCSFTPRHLRPEAPRECFGVSRSPKSRRQALNSRVPCMSPQFGALCGVQALLCMHQEHRGISAGPKRCTACTHKYVSNIRSWCCRRTQASKIRFNGRTDHPRDKSRCCLASVFRRKRIRWLDYVENCLSQGM